MVKLVQKSAFTLAQTQKFSEVESKVGFAKPFSFATITHKLTLSAREISYFVMAY